jgi:malic enzyme
MDRSTPSESLVGLEETLSHALERLNASGYCDDFRACGGGLRAAMAGRTYEPEALLIDEAVRLEGATDPDDEAIVFALRAPDGVRGTYSVAYGPLMAAADADVVGRLGAPPAMERFRLEHDADGEYVETGLRGRALLRHPLYNKGTAFGSSERRALGLNGLLPPMPSTDAVQRARAYEHIARKSDALERYIGMAALQDRNEVLFYKVLTEHLEELAPIVYTPTVGRACQEFSHIFRRGRGVWISPGDRGRIAETLANGAYGDTRLIVVTDNERILGLGDQGAGGMGIPIGKLALYTVGAGIHPAWCLPVSLDVGSDNRALLDDPLYLGWRAPRLRGRAYEDIVDEFVRAVTRMFPRALLQWEDFKKRTAFSLLDRYRDRLPSFNDDIQGTAAVTVAGVKAACRLTGTALAAQRVVIVGAGAAGVGIARQLTHTLEREGVAPSERRRAVALLDSKGLLVAGEPHEDYKAPFAWPPELVRACGLDDAGRRDLYAVVTALRPTVFIGATGQPCLFTEKVIRAVAAGCARPVVMPLSNPTSKCEAPPADVLRWTEGRAIVATGSPFPPVALGGRSVRVGQGNNVFVFPGVGLGVIASGARRVTDSMFTVAPDEVAAAVTQAELDSGALFPSIARLRAISAAIATRVVIEAGRAGLAPLLDEEHARARVAALMWAPRYPEVRSRAAKT